jgi:hypothetical protein
MLTTQQFVTAYLNILAVIENKDYRLNFTKYLKTRLKEMEFNRIIVDTSTTPELLQMFFDKVGLDVHSEEHVNLKGVMMALLEEDKVFLNKLSEKVSQTYTIEENNEQ